MKILRFEEVPKSDEYFRNLMLKYVINNKLIRLTEIIFDELEVEYQSSDEFIEIKEIIRITFEECQSLLETSTLNSLRTIIRDEISEYVES